MSIQDGFILLIPVYSEVWLNLPWEDRYFSLHLAMDDCHFGYKQKTLKI